MTDTATLEQDPLDELPKADPLEVIALLLWRDRHRNPELSVQITREDIRGFRDCVNYLTVQPVVRIERPQGRPATPEVPATKKRSAIPAREAEPPKPFVVVQLVDHEGNGFRPIENSEEGAKLRDRETARRRHRDNAPMLASKLMADMQSGTFSTATIMEAAQALQALAQG